MKLTVRDIQARCAALGFWPGPIDGIEGRRTRAAVRDAIESRGVTTVRGLFHPSGIRRVHMHWSGGNNQSPSREDQRAYNVMVNYDGEVFQGDATAEDQAAYQYPYRGGSHTLDCNTGALGDCLLGMADANERPFRSGNAPIGWRQIEVFTQSVAMQCVLYDLQVSKYDTLTHAEIQPTLGVRQRWKWDIVWLPDMDGPGDAVQVGDRMRAMIREHVQDIEAIAA